MEEEFKEEIAGWGWRLNMRQEYHGNMSMRVTLYNM